MLGIFYVCVQCINLLDLNMAAECPASIFPIVFLHCWNSLSVDLAGWGETDSESCLLLFFLSKPGIFSVHKDTDYSYISFHTSQDVKIQIGKTVLPYFTDFWNSLKILILMETNGSDVEYEIRFCHQCFYVERKNLVLLEPQLNFRNRLFNTAGGERLLDFYLNCVPIIISQLSMAS